MCVLGQGAAAGVCFGGQRSPPYHLPALPHTHHPLHPCTHPPSAQERLVKIGKKLKKNNVAVDIVSFGCEVGGAVGGRLMQGGYVCVYVRGEKGRRRGHRVLWLRGRGGGGGRAKGGAGDGVWAPAYAPVPPARECDEDRRPHAHTPSGMPPTAPRPLRSL